MSTLNPQTDDEYSQTLGLIFILAMGSLVAALGLYFWHFHGPFVTESGKWNDFGGYLGGTVGPIFGFFSLLVLLASLRVQRSTYVEVKRQGVLSELQRLMSVTASNIDAALQRPSVELWGAAGGGIDQLVRGNGLRAATVREAFGLLWNAMQQSERLRLDSWFATAELSESNDVFRGLLLLDACLVEFLGRGGDPVIGSLYGRAYADSARVLAVISELGQTVKFDAQYPLTATDRLGTPLRREELERITDYFRELDRAYQSDHAARQQAILHGGTPPA